MTQYLNQWTSCDGKSFMTEPYMDKNFAHKPTSPFKELFFGGFCQQELDNYEFSKFLLTLLTCSGIHNLRRKIEC